LSFIICLKARKTILSTKETATQTQLKITRPKTTTICHAKTTIISSKIKTLTCGIHPLRNNLIRKANGSLLLKEKKVLHLPSNKLQLKNNPLPKWYRPVRNPSVLPLITLTKNEITKSPGKFQKKRRKNPPHF